MREKRNIIKIIKKKPKTTTSEIATEIQERVQNQVHSKTIQRVLHRAGYRSGVARRKPFISKINKKKRLEFAKQYINVNPDFENNVIFSDESKFNIYESDGCKKIWRKPNTELETKNLKSTVKHGSESVMV